MKLPEDQRITEVKLPNGERHSIDQLLTTAFKSYVETRKTYNLSRRTRKNQPRQTGGSKRINSKYTAEDAIWMRDRTAEQIAVQYKITKHQAYYVKNYVRKLFGE